MIDFPDNPEPDQKFITPNGLMYVYDGIKWNSVRSEAQLLPDHKVNNGKFLASNGTDYVWYEMYE